MGFGIEPAANIFTGLVPGDFGIDSPIESRRPVVGFALRSGITKDMPTAFRAAEIIRRSRPDASVECFGRGVDAPPFIVQHNRLSHGELRSFYNRCAVFMVTSTHEGWGLPAHEAMACGAATVSTRNGGVRDLIEEGVTGLLTPVGDPDAVASRVLELLEQPSQRIRIATAGAQRASSLTVSNAVAVIEKLAADASGVPRR